MQRPETHPRPSLLVAVLDWGMGHATRTLPLIEHARDQGWHVHVASKGYALEWLSGRLRGVEHVTLHHKPGPEISYAKRGNLVKIVRQLPSFLRHVEAERQWTESFVQDHDIQAVFSDNCYGCAHPEVPSVLMSHQLQLPVPSPMKRSARKVVSHWASAFQEVWVPDVAPGDLSLSGALADTDIHPATHYVGVLSRLTKHRLAKPTKTWSKLGMVSGVEPHRSLMEEALKAWMADTQEPCLLVAGKPGMPPTQEGHITVWNDPEDHALAGALQQAEVVLCRSGYSSQLDLAALGVNAILVPTPGQPEQTMLGRLWADRFGFACIDQSALQQGLVPERATGQLPAHEPNALAFARMSAWLDQCLASASEPLLA